MTKVVRLPPAIALAAWAAARLTRIMGEVECRLLSDSRPWRSFLRMRSVSPCSVSAATGLTTRRAFRILVRVGIRYDSEVLS